MPALFPLKPRLYALSLPLGLSKSGLISWMVLIILNIESSKCPEISNSLFHTFPDQTFSYYAVVSLWNGKQCRPLGSLIWVYTVCINHFVRNLRKYMRLTKAGRNGGVVVISSGRNSRILLYPLSNIIISII